MRDYLVGRHEGMPQFERAATMDGRNQSFPRTMAPYLLAVVIAESAADAVQQVADEMHLDHEARLFAVPVQDFSAELEVRDVSVAPEA